MKRLRLDRKALEIWGFALVMLVASITRLWNLALPKKLVFDETYYVKDALSLSQEVHERNWPDQPRCYAGGNGEEVRGVATPPSI